MLADKTLLSVTLAATFASGSFVGFTVHDRLGGAGPLRKDADAIYAPQLAELRAKGYSAEEVAEARRAYAKYLKGYEYHWNEYLDANPKPFDKLDDELERQLEALRAKHESRAK